MKHIISISVVKYNATKVASNPTAEAICQKIFLIIQDVKPCHKIRGRSYVHTMLGCAWCSLSLRGRPLINLEEEWCISRRNPIQGYLQKKMQPIVSTFTEKNPSRSKVA